MYRGIQSFFKIVSVLVFLFPFYKSNAEELSLRSERNDITFRPFMNHDGYFQAWNMSFHNEATHIYITFLVSNIGPGTLNNGVSILIHENGKSRVFTAEYDGSSFKSYPDHFELVFGYRQKLEKHNDTIAAYADIKGMKVHIYLKPTAPGVRISGGEIPVSSRKGESVRADIFVPVGDARAVVDDGKSYRELKGYGGLEHIGTNLSPHIYAKSFQLTRSYHHQHGIFIGGFHGNRSFPNGNIIRFIYDSIKQPPIAATIHSINVEQDTPDPFSAGYRIPLKTIYHVMLNDKKCKASEERSGLIGEFDLLGTVSPLLRMAVHLIFSKPYLIHYAGRVVIECDVPKNDPMFKMEFPVEISYYMINP